MFSSVYARIMVERWLSVDKKYAVEKWVIVERIENYCYCCRCWMYKFLKSFYIFNGRISLGTIIIKNK